MNEYIEFLEKSISTLPELTNVIPSARTVNILHNLAYSNLSEMSAISTYLYQHFILKKRDQEAIRDALEKISIQEMRHLDALGNAIVDFGGNPRLVNSRGLFWSGRYLNYEQNIQRFLRDNIRAERLAIADYLNAADNVSNESLKNLFYAIVKQEEIHIDIFEMMLERLGN